MAEVVPFVLAAWVVLTVEFFRRWNGREAALVSLIAGWALLPNAPYPDAVFGRPTGTFGWMHALAIPTDILLNKATAIGLGCLAGVLVFDTPLLRRLRWSWLDLSVGLWCLAPLVSVEVNTWTLGEGLSQCRYLLLVWAVPYFLGRLYLGDGESLRRFALALFVGGLVYVPVCLAEFVLAPFAYELVYGPHPYRFEGADRWLGYRPLVFQEHGNQLGIWVVSAAVAGLWLARAGRLPRPRERWRTGVILVAGTALVNQSHGALVFGLLALAPLVWRPFLPGGKSGLAGAYPRWLGAAVLTLALVGAAVLAAWVARDPSARVRLRETFGAAGKLSFTWRLGRIEEGAGRLGAHPVVGYGRADWSGRPDGRFVNPVNMALGLLVTGMYGYGGLAMLVALTSLPVWFALRRLPTNAWLSPRGCGVALTAVLVLLNLADSLLNSTWLMPLTAGIGGLATWSERKNATRS